MIRHRNAAPAAAALLAALAAPVHAAAPDGTVEWNGISHYTWQDRRPLCPRAGEAFQVRFQAWRNDLTAARVRVDTGAVSFVDAAVVAQRGPYDVWAATVPASAPAGSLSYVIELTDGADVDWFGAGGAADNLPGAGLVVDFATLSHAPYGATPSTGGVVFRVWSPGRTGAHVRGTFNAEAATNPMTPLGEDFIAFVPGAQVGDQYRYSFDNGVWNADPRGRSLTSAATQKAIVFDPLSYAWQSNAYATPALEDMVVYQLHVGTFAGRNDPLGPAANPSRFIDVANRVDHLANLGVNAIMVCPFTAFPSDFSAGYNPISLYAPEAKYGLPDQLKFMVDRCHEKGIAVLLDLVWNHFSATDNYLWNYNGDQIYYDTPNMNTPWGPQLDFDRPQVADYVAHSAHYWLEEYRLDGYRMDGTDYMNIGAQEAAGWGLMQRFNNEIDNRWADKVTIAEQLPNDPWVTLATASGGAGFDAQYQDKFNDDLRQELQDAAFGDPEMAKIAGIVNGSGAGIQGRSAFNYLELHDEAWPASGGQRFVKTIDPSAPHDDEWARGRTKLGQGMVLFSPGVPALLQGTEWLEDTDFGTAADGSSKIDWSKMTTYASTYRFYQDAIRFRRAYGSFRANAGHQVFHVNDGGNVIAFQRWDLSGNVFVVIANFGTTDYPVYRLGLPQAGAWTEVLNSQSAVYGGSGLDNPLPIASQAIAYDGYGQSAEIRIPKMGFLLLKWGTNTVGVPSTGPAPAAFAFGAVVPNPAPAAARFEFTQPAPGRARVTVHDAAGRVVAVVADRAFGAGPQAATWDGALAAGGPAPAGVYFARIEAAGTAIVRKFVRTARPLP
jgi:1,4-alpha-glucan branching enzyme